jgi:hypothetical protein
MGLCVAKTRTVAPVSAGEATEEALCQQHGTDAGGALTGEPVATKHCPQDDPGAQVRSGDLPAATLMPAIDNRLRITVPDPAAGLCSNSPDDSPQTRFTNGCRVCCCSLPVRASAVRSLPRVDRARPVMTEGSRAKASGCLRFSVLVALLAPLHALERSRSGRQRW